MIRSLSRSRRERRPSLGHATLPNHVGVPKSVEIRALAAQTAEWGTSLEEGAGVGLYDADELTTVARALLVYDVTEHLPAVIASRLGAVAYRMAERHAAPTHVGRAMLAELRAYIDADLYHRDAEGSLDRHACKQCRRPHDACCTGEVLPARRKTRIPIPPKPRRSSDRSARGAGRCCAHAFSAVAVLRPLRAVPAVRSAVPPASVLGREGAGAGRRGGVLSDVGEALVQIVAPFRLQRWVDPATKDWHALIQDKGQRVSDEHIARLVPCRSLRREEQKPPKRWRRLSEKSKRDLRERIKDLYLPRSRVVIDRDAPQTWAEFVDVLPDEAPPPLPRPRLADGRRPLRRHVPRPMGMRGLRLRRDDRDETRPRSPMRWVTKKRGPRLIRKISWLT